LRVRDSDRFPAVTGPGSTCDSVRARAGRLIGRLPRGIQQPPRCYHCGRVGGPADRCRAETRRAPMSVLINRVSEAKKEAGDYTEALFRLLGDRDPLAVLEKTPFEITRLVTRVARDDMARPEAPGKWSMLQVLRHLADSELVWGYRLRR